jgi:hypothetical protein
MNKLMSAALTRLVVRRPHLSQYIDITLQGKSQK